MTTLSRIAVVALVTVLAGSLAGCPVIGWVATQLAPPKTIKPKFEPPKDRRVLVFVDDAANPVSYPDVKKYLTEYLGAILVVKKVAASSVSYERVLDLIAETPKFNSMSMGEVGRKLGADWVLYLDVKEFSLRDNEISTVWKGQFKVQVKVIDVNKGKLWPDNSIEGDNFVETPTVENDSAAFAGDLSRTLSLQMADKVGKLFYEYKISAREDAEKASEPLTP